MTDRIRETSPRFVARMAGVFYLLNGLTDAFALVYVPGRLVVRNDAAATAANILANEPLFRLGFAADVVAVATYVAVTALFYILFKPVNKSLALLAAFFGLMLCAVEAFSCLFHFAPLVVLGGAPYLSVFKVEQLQALAFMFLKLNAAALNISLVFSGFYFLLIGTLIFRSTFLPRILGALIIIDGLGYLTQSFANFLAPAFAAHLYPYVLMPAVAEALLGLWLLVIGVNVSKWKTQASAAAECRS